MLPELCNMPRHATKMRKKITIALVTTTRRMRVYFHNHPIIVRTDNPIVKLLSKLNLAKRMIGWSVELSKYGTSMS